VLKSLVLLIKRQECERGAAKRRKDKELVDDDRESCTVESSDHCGDDFLNDKVEGDTAVSLMMVRASSKEKDQVDEVAAKISTSQSSYHSKKKSSSSPKSKGLVDEDKESCTIESNDHCGDDEEVEADTVVSEEKKVDFLGFSILSKHAKYLKIIYQKEATFMDDAMKAGFRLDCIDFCTSKATNFLFMEANKTQLKTEMKEVTQKIASLQKELELKKVGETELKKQFEAISEFSSNSSSPLSYIVD
ncbi:hypothetical protein Godav_027246, partial [Gossypium davidsonii]|nr:hypothetical protein [Gossypium davidsonii]MBA0653177.1 hypothetical protein [Gossypium klotzschianum]